MKLLIKHIALLSVASFILFSCKENNTQEISVKELKVEKLDLSDTVFYEKSSTEFESKFISTVLNDKTKPLVEVSTELKSQISQITDLEVSQFTSYYYRKFEGSDLYTPMVLLITNMSSESLVFITLSKDQKIVEYIDLVKDKCSLIEQTIESEIVSCELRRSSYDEVARELTVLRVLTEETYSGKADNAKVSKDSISAFYKFIPSTGKMVLEKSDSIRVLN